MKSRLLQSYIEAGGIFYWTIVKVTLIAFFIGISISLNIKTSKDMALAKHPERFFLFLDFSLWILWKEY